MHNEQWHNGILFAVCCLLSAHLAWKLGSLSITVLFYFIYPELFFTVNTKNEKSYVVFVILETVEVSGFLFGFSFLFSFSGVKCFQ
jgi:hypothetical protein